MTHTPSTHARNDIDTAPASTPAADASTPARGSLRTRAVGKTVALPESQLTILDGIGLAHHYLEFGSYLSQWRRRNALKMWSGWPTFPMVFAKGVLIGGANDLQRLLASGELMRFLGEP